MHFPCIHTLFSIYLLYLNCFRTFLIASLSLSLFPFTLVVSMVPKRKSTSSLFVSGHRLLLILLLLIFGSVMRMPERTSWRTFLDEVFIWNAKSFWQTLPTLTFPLSFTVRDGSHCVTSWSLVHPYWSKSFTPTCMDSIFQYLSFLLAFEVHAL